MAAPTSSKIPESVVEAVVKEAGAKMNDPSYAERLVSTLIASQNHVTQYLTSKQAKLGGAEGVLHLLFHTALMASCFARHHGRSLPQLTFADLDEAATGSREAELKKRQPALHDYLVLNVEAVEAQRTLMLVALSFDRVA